MFRIHFFLFEEKKHLTQGSLHCNSTSKLLPRGAKMTPEQNLQLQMTDAIFCYLLHLQQSEDIMKVLSSKDSL